MNSLFSELSEILKESGSFGEFLKKKYEREEEILHSGATGRSPAGRSCGGISVLQAA